MKFLTGMIAALLAPSIAAAQTAEPAASTASERRLSPEQIEAILEDAAKRRQAEASQRAPELQPEAPRPTVHGEVGFGIGTGGYREAFGTAIYPLGDDGVAAISMDFVDLGRRRDRR